MNQHKHTPGPWEIQSRFVGPLLIVRDGETLAMVGADTFPVCQANAHLIAAAPDMLQTLHLALGFLRRIGRDDDPCGAEIERVIHKATAHD